MIDNVKLILIVSLITLILNNLEYWKKIYIITFNILNNFFLYNFYNLKS